MNWEHNWGAFFETSIYVQLDKDVNISQVTELITFEVDTVYNVKYDQELKKVQEYNFI